ncbi:hypothetical protein [Lentzea cavernae]|uniref:Uncharacterized protein n=1 Tax=Lentzea cavernae TaxID=2020703 RepID=A0ABQ3MQK5_9PSEU|nr:hypothetical protein [Lentzea cavernae]GHH56981.1 hypothetical protein GCM10017774_75800 [Lentzea cavernae]
MSAPTITRTAHGPQQPGSVSTRAFQHEDGKFAQEFSSPVLTAPVELRNCGEIAAALHLSGRPLSNKLTVAELAELVVFALVTVGLDSIRHFDRAATVAMLTSARHHDRTGEELIELLPWSVSRMKLCTGLAYRLTCRAWRGGQPLPSRADAVPADLS